MKHELNKDLRSWEGRRRLFERFTTFGGAALIGIVAGRERFFDFTTDIDSIAWGATIMTPISISLLLTGVIGLLTSYVRIRELDAQIRKA